MSIYLLFISHHHEPASPVLVLPKGGTKRQAHAFFLFCLEEEKGIISGIRMTGSSNIAMVTVKVEALNVSFCQCALPEISLALELK